MSARSSLTSKIAFWGICAVIVAWIAATIVFEINLGWPATGVQVAKRIVGWGVEIMLIRTLIIGTRKCRGAASLNNFH
jgi:hypothetical protein